MLKRWGGGGDLTEYWIEIHWGGAKRWSGRGKSSQESLGPYQLTFCSADIHRWVSLWINANLSLLPKLCANRNGVYGTKHQQGHGDKLRLEIFSHGDVNKVWCLVQTLITWPPWSCLGIKTALLGSTWSIGSMRKANILKQNSPQQWFYGSSDGSQYYANAATIK